MGRSIWRTWFVRILVLLQLLWLPHAAMAAAYATDGEGKYKDQILWLTWGDESNPYGKAGQALGAGARSVANLPVTDGKNLQVTCTLQNPSGALRSYRPGAYGMDRLNYLYRVGTQLISGVANTVNGATVSFQVNCSANVDGAPVDLKGFVIADAESMGNNEYIQSEAEGDWFVIDRYQNQPARGQYVVTKSALGSGVNGLKVASTVGDPGNTTVNFLKFTRPEPSKTMQFSVKGGGITAIAIGVVLLSDFGDAPSSYGDAMHVIGDMPLSQDSIGSSGSADAAGTASSGFVLAQFQSPSIDYLGTRGPDAEPASQSGFAANGDDANGLYQDEENGWPAQYKSLSGLLAGGQLSVPVTCKGSGFVTGWIDFNVNGVFDAGERSQIAACSGTAQLQWTVPQDVKATASGNNSYVRLRYATRAAEIQNATGFAQDGEVEDHAITILQPKLSIAKSSNAGAAGWTVGQSGAIYTLTVSNQGPVSTGTSSTAGAVKPLKVLDSMPNGIVPGWTGTQVFNGWSCSASGQLVTCETSNHLQAQGTAGSSTSFDLPVQVQAAAATGNDLVNYASVGGGLDPNNGGEPPSPQGCTTAGYCASTTVSIGEPGITVTKTASPASQSQVKVGDTINYTLVVTVKTAATLSPVVLKDTLGAGLKYAGIASNAGGFIEGGSGLSRSFTLPTGKQPGQYTITYKATVEKDAKTSVNNLVTPTGGGSPNDPNADNPSCVGGCSTTHTLAGPLVTVTKLSDPASGTTVKEGQVITYTIRTVVERSQTLSPVVLTDTLGAALKVGAVISNQGYVLARSSGTSGTLTLPTGTAPGTYEIKYTAQVNAAVSGSQNLSNVVTATGGGNEGETPTCTTCQTNHNLSKPKVEYSKSTRAVTAKIDGEIRYQIDVKVTDAPTTDVVTLTDTFQTGLQFSRMQDGGSFTQVSSTSNSLVLSLPKGTPPGTYQAVYFAKVIATTPPVQNVVNGVVATGGDSPVCVAPGCTTTTPLTYSNVDYHKALLGSPKEVKVGQQLEFVMTIDVADTATARARVFKDTLGTGLIKNTTAPVLPSTQWSAQWTSNNELSVTTPATLPVGSYQVHYFATVTKDAVGTVKNSVSAEPVAGVPTPNCSVDCATETPVAPPKISYHKTSTATSAKIGDSIPYVLTITLADAALTADAELLVDNLSQGLTFNNDAASSSAQVKTTLNGQSLVIKFLKGTAPGRYTVTYSALVGADAVKSVNNRVDTIPSDSGLTPVCDASCSVVTPIVRLIDAVDDPLPSVSSTLGSPYAGNAYDNDTLNGVPVELGKITGKVMTPATPINGGSVPVLDVATGIVSVPAGTPAGDYSIVYQICDKLQPTLCDTATITIKVTASPIDAKDDTYTGNRGSGDQVVGNAYSENDTLDGTPFTPDRITGTVTTPAQPLGGDPRVPVLDVTTGKVTVPSGTPAGDYTINYRICEKLNPTNCDDAVIKVTVKPDESLLRIVKTAAVRTVKIGDLVRYSLQVQNVGSVPVVNANVIDTAANGFTFVEGSMSAVGLGSSVSASGVRPVQFSGVTLAVGQTGTITYMMRVGAGVRPGNHVNTAFARNNVGDSISNQATASVELVSDPLLDDSLIFGTVFDDRDRDGWQDSAKVSGLKAQGGFAPAAYIANSTTVDRGDGQGAQPAADASAPLLHGLALGSITARQSEADPVAKHTVVIHQKLASLDFTDDFVLSNDQGVTVRMDAAGKTTVEKTGEAAAGRNAVALEVERKISQVAGGYGVDYIIRSTGIDERGIPGVRVASVEGLLMETDPFGRYHLVGVNGGRWERGRNFILKVDPSTLPAGAEFTTSNPLLRRITPGLPVRFDFGVQLNPEFMAAEQKTAEIELGSVLFAAGSTEIRSQYLGENSVIAKVAAKVQQYGGGDLLISANGESEAVAFGRADAVRKAIVAQLPADVQAATKVTVRSQVNDAGSLVSGVTANGAVLGTVLFETDKSVVRPEFQELLQKVAAYLNAQGGGIVSIVGHTDVRASHAYNQKLGLARAKAVYEALLPHLSGELKQKLQVQAEEGAAPASAHRSNKKATTH